MKIDHFRHKNVSEKSQTGFSLSGLLSEQHSLFTNERQSMLYITLLQHGPLGAEKLHQVTGLHRETVQRELMKMERLGTVQFLPSGNKKRAKACSLQALQERLLVQQDQFSQLLQPLLTAATQRHVPLVSVLTGDYHFGLLQMQLLRLQPAGTTLRVLSTQPRAWVQAMQEAKRLQTFEKLRIQKEVRWQLSCFSGQRGEVEYNNREYFAGQPVHLKRVYRYVETVLTSPLQTQVWFQHVVISIFDAVPSIHIVLEDSRVVRAMEAYFHILWSVESSASVVSE